MPATVAAKPAKRKKAKKAKKKAAAKKIVKKAVKKVAKAPAPAPAGDEFTDAQRGTLLRLLKGNEPAKKVHHATRKALVDRGFAKELKNGMLKITAAGKKALKK